MKPQRGTLPAIARTLLLLAAALLAVALNGTAARAADVETDYDTEFEFGKLNYYQWAEDADNIDEAYSSLPKDNIKLGLEQRLEQKMVPANADHKADALVRYYVKDVKKMVDDRPRIGIGMGGYGGDRGGISGGGVGFSFPLGGSDLDRQAQIVIDILDPHTQRLLWRGSQLVGMSSGSAQLNERQVNKAAGEILKKFPPR